MSNVKGQPGYIDMSAKPDHKPKPMQPRGSVRPPPTPKKASGKERKAIKDRATRLVEKTLNSAEWFVVAYRINPDTGAVEMAYEMCNYPHNAFEESAQLYADVLTKTLGADFQQHPPAAQTSEPVAEVVAETGGATLGTEPVTLPLKLDDEAKTKLDAALDGLPNTLGGSFEPPEPGHGEPD